MIDRPWLRGAAALAVVAALVAWYWSDTERDFEPFYVSSHDELVAFPVQLIWDGDRAPQSVYVDGQREVADWVAPDGSEATGIDLVDLEPQRVESSTIQLRPGMYSLRFYESSDGAFDASGRHSVPGAVAAKYEGGVAEPIRAHMGLLGTIVLKPFKDESLVRADIRPKASSPWFWSVSNRSGFLFPLDQERGRTFQYLEPGLYTVEIMDVRQKSVLASADVAVMGGETKTIDLSD